MNVISSVFDLPKNSIIAIYGCGETGQALLKLLRNSRQDILIKYFLDSTKSGEIYNIELLKYNSKSDKIEGLLIIIASVFWGEIFNNISKNHRSRCIVLENKLLYELTPLAEISPFVYSEEEYLKKSDQFRHVIKLFPSKVDKEIYKTLILLHHPEKSKRCKATIKISRLKSTATPYLEYFSLDKGDYVVEGGVFDGQDSIKFCQIVGEQGKVLGFEPMPSYLINQKYWEALSTHKAFELIQMALWSGKGTLSLDVSDGSSSATKILGEDGSAIVQSTSLDEYLLQNPCEHIELIKMDIEGAELKALQGMQSTIKTMQPVLAIALYHHRDHLYEIPTMINNMGVKYKYHLSNYTGSFIDTVLYALPPRLFIK